MKTILEPNEILIQIMPSPETSSGYYYTVKTKNLFRLYDDLPKMFDEIEKILAIYPKETKD